MIKKALGLIYLKNFKSNNRLERIWKIAQVDFKKRYYNDKAGLLWAFINPITQILLYHFVFTNILQKDKENFVPYLFCGILIWLSFTEATKKGMQVFTNKKYLIENIQFDWKDLYISHMFSVSFGLTFNFLAYFIILIFIGVNIGSHFFYLPIILLTWFILTLGLTMILGIIRPVIDDIVHIWSLLLLVGFWVSGIFFSGTYYFENHPWFPHINPFIGIILNLRGCLLENNPFFPTMMIENLIYAVVVLVIALLLFKKYSKKVVERI